MAELQLKDGITNPTSDPMGGEATAQQAVLGNASDADTQEIINSLTSYHAEADYARKGGMNPRDDKWQENLDLYWNRRNWSNKASWQAREQMPEVPAFVDRFAAALKEALVSSPNGFYTVVDPTDAEGDLAKAVKRITDVWLSISGRNQTGTYLDFSAVFEEQVKLGALMACSSVVTWKGDREGGRVSIETIDPRNVWLDHTGRNLYRNRRWEIDRHELAALMRRKDGKGKHIYNVKELERLTSSMEADMRRQQEEMTGGGAMITSARNPIVIDEYLATVVSNDGRILADRALMELANGQCLIRGPEENPFWHGKDWMVHTPLVHTPLSVYGRTYMEDFGSVARTFEELTNLILDATRTSAMKAWAVVPGMLLNPKQIQEGLSPNKLFLLEEGSLPAEFAKELELGQLPPEVVQVWQSMKQELREAADINEVGLGQFAPKGRTSATEIGQTMESSSALIRSVAQTVETRWLDPTLDLVWKTGMQHVGAKDREIVAAAGEDMWAALHKQRRDLISRPITFQARGISMLIQKSRMLKSLLTMLQIVSENDLLMQEFLKVADLGKFTKLLFELSDVDLRKLQLTEREKAVRNAVEQMQAGGQQAAARTPGQQPNGATQQAAQGMAKSMGVQR